MVALGRVLGGGGVDGGVSMELLDSSGETCIDSSQGGVNIVSYRPVVDGKLVSESSPVAAT